MATDAAIFGRFIIFDLFLDAAGGWGEGSRMHFSQFEYKSIKNDILAAGFLYNKRQEERFIGGLPIM